MVKSRQKSITIAVKQKVRDTQRASTFFSSSLWIDHSRRAFSDVDVYSSFVSVRALPPFCLAQSNYLVRSLKKTITESIENERREVKKSKRARAK